MTSLVERPGRVIAEGCRARGGGSRCRGELSCGPRRVTVRAGEDCRVTESCRCYHADYLPCCGNCPRCARQLSAARTTGLRDATTFRGPHARPAGRGNPPRYEAVRDSWLAVAIAALLGEVPAEPT